MSSCFPEASVTNGYRPFYPNDMRKRLLTSSSLLLVASLSACVSEEIPDRDISDEQLDAAYEAIEADDLAVVDEASVPTLSEDEFEAMRELARLDTTDPELGEQLEQLRERLSALPDLPDLPDLNAMELTTELDPVSSNADCTLAHTYSEWAQSAATIAKDSARFNYLLYNPYYAYSCYFDATIVNLNSQDIVDYADGSDFSTWSKNNALSLVNNQLYWLDKSTYTCAVTAFAGDNSWANNAWQWSQLTEDFILSTQSKLQACDPLF